jgi:hypothetical protein
MMKRKNLLVSLSASALAFAAPALVLAFELPSFPGFPGIGTPGTGTTNADKANVLLECGLVNSQSTTTLPGGGSSCSSSSSGGSVSCSSSSSGGTVPSNTVPVMTFEAFHASANAPDAIVDLLGDAVNGSCADAIALIETESGSSAGACSGPTGFGASGLVFSCTIQGDGSL